MQDVMNAVRGEAERVSSRISTLRMGTVSSYDPGSYSVKVRLQPEDIETGWVPVMSPSVGNGFGLFSPPTPGDAVVVGFQEGNTEVPIVLGGLYNDVDRPDVQGAGGVPSGDKWLVHPKGMRIRLHGEGVEILCKAGTVVRLSLDDGTVDISGPDVRIGAQGGTFQKLVNESFMQIFNTHVHGTSPPPVPLMTPANLTASLRGA